MRLVVIVVAALMFLAGCSSGDTEPTLAAEEIKADSPNAEAAQESFDAANLAIAPGGLAAGAVTINETVIDYVTVTPADFSIGDTAPVLLVLPPGGQDLNLTQSVVEATFADEAVARGWVVVSPAAPDGELFFKGSEIHIPGLVAWMAAWVEAEGGKPHLAGISNGGISSFRVATQNPTAFKSVVVFPGFPRSDADKEGLAKLSDVPIRMFVGEEDTGWVEPMQEAADRLTAADGDVTFEIFPKEGHIIGALRDGVRVFDELEANR